uniref:Potassium channel domain-containing protein n=1 Tax=Ditylenchus dipsaci TaxID=166011 RepID=A0A915DLX6_9BILA
MDFFKALYFNYVTITTIGLGDVVPKSHNYLLFTFIYITIGLSLTTMAVEIAADYLKSSITLEEKMKLKNLIKHLGDQLNVPVEELEHLNIDQFVNSALQVADGQTKTEDRPISFSDIRKEVDSRNIEFADDE